MNWKKWRSGQMNSLTAKARTVAHRDERKTSVLPSNEHRLTDWMLLVDSVSENRRLGQKIIISRGQLSFFIRRWVKFIAPFSSYERNIALENHYQLKQITNSDLMSLKGVSESLTDFGLRLIYVFGHRCCWPAWRRSSIIRRYTFLDRSASMHLLYNSLNQLLWRRQLL